MRRKGREAEDRGVECVSDTAWLVALPLRQNQGGQRRPFVFLCVTTALFFLGLVEVLKALNISQNSLSS